MANDRMYIRCKGCGDLHYLAKCYDDGYFTTHEGEELRQGLDDFFDRHKWCYRSIYGGFELVYESDEDAESEDERIRKELKEAFEAYDIESKWNGIPIRSIFAWLEKQKDINCLACDQNLKGYIAGRKATEEEKQKEQKPAWSEEDEKMRDRLITRLNWITYNTRTDGTSPNITFFDEIAWLKSLRPQYHGDVTMTEAYKMGLEAGKASSWKPSEEQMSYLLSLHQGGEEQKPLRELIEQLKKLM